MTSSTTEWVQRAKSVMAPTYDPPDMVLSHGDGVWVWDLTGTKFLDFSSGMGVNALGHAHPEIAAAITDQAKKLCHTSNAFLHGPHIEMCERLAAKSFGQRVFLCNSGTEANEGAMKMSRRHFTLQGTPRTRFVATHNSFHGRTIGASSLTNQKKCRDGMDPMLDGVSLVPFGDIEAMRSAITRETAAVFVEPIQGNAGVILPPPGYLSSLRSLCTDLSVLLVFDEIQTGLGRTGDLFAYEHEGVIPDIMTLAKAVGGGLPLGAVITSEEIASCVSGGFHGNTFGGNPVACRAGLATLAVIERDNLVAHAREVGAQFLAGLKSTLSSFANVREVRGRGALIGIQLTEDPTPMRNKLLEAGLLVTLAGNNTLRLLPPLISKTEHCEQAVETLTRCLRSRN